MDNPYHFHYIGSIWFSEDMYKVRIMLNNSNCRRQLIALNGKFSDVIVSAVASIYLSFFQNGHSNIPISSQ